MVDLLFSYPLNWPNGRKTTPSHEKGQASGVPPTLKIEDSIEYVRSECIDFPAEEITLTSDFEHIQNSQNRKKSGISNGASLLIEHAGLYLNITCDKYTLIQLNIYALHLMLRHTKQMVKWGLGDIPTLLSGYRVNHASVQTLMSPINGNEWWLQYLGLGSTARISDANAVYRSRAKDAAENSDMLLKLNEAIAMARHNLKA